MARGQAGAADNQRKLSNTQGGSEFGNAQQLYGTLNPALKDQMNNPGYTAGQKADITNTTMQGIGSTYDAANQANNNRVARTRNSAGSTELADDLARQKASTVANATAGLGTKFADTALSERDKAQQALSSLYGMNTSAGTSLYGQGAGDLNARAAGQNWTQGFANVVGAIRPNGGGQG